MMKIIHILGRQKNGKTTLIVDLVNEFMRRGIQAGTLKHSSHTHELDKPGKDSYRHREAGACPSAIATKDSIAVYLPRKPGENPFQKINGLYRDVDIILVEGYISGPGKKIEVWRKAVGTVPISTERNDIQAVVTDDPLDTALPVWPRSDIRHLADQVLGLAGIDINQNRSRSMKVKHYSQIDPKHFEGDAVRGAAGRVLIGQADGARNFCMRMFELAPEGFTPRHAHDWEHEIFVHSGEGAVLQNGEWVPVTAGNAVFIPNNEEHQIKNTGSVPFLFVCLVPSGPPEL